MKYTVDNDALEMARQNMERLREEYRTAKTDRINAMYRYLEAERAYTSLLKLRYNI